MKQPKAPSVRPIMACGLLVSLLMLAYAAVADSLS